MADYLKIAKRALAEYRAEHPSTIVERSPVILEHGPATAPPFVGAGQPEQAGVSTKVMITKADAAALGQLGYTPEQINGISPEMAGTILERRTPASARNRSGTLPEEPQQEGKIEPQERGLPRCPRCSSYALYRKSNQDDFECCTCELQGITEADAWSRKPSGQTSVDWDPRRLIRRLAQLGQSGR